jgi:hypothetical protein
MIDVRDLEKKYMDKIWEIVSSNNFSEDLIKIESFIKANYRDLNERYQIKNKLQLAAERLMYFYMHKELNIQKIYCSPISSDLAFYTDDALINIDAKTIDLAGNPGDDNWVQFGPHQITFTNKTFFNRRIDNVDFKGMGLKPGLPEIDPETNLPCLTFFVGITYKDDGDGFDISHIKVTCVPNGKIIREDYSDEVISNFKTYKYLKEHAATIQGEEYIPKAKNIAIPSTWIPFSLNGRGRDDAWFDRTLMGPFDHTRNVVWKIIAKKYHVCLGGDTARISPELIKNRTCANGTSWIGVKKQFLRRD